MEFEQLIYTMINIFDDNHLYNDENNKIWTIISLLGVSYIILMLRGLVKFMDSETILRVFILCSYSSIGKSVPVTY